MSRQNTNIVQSAHFSKSVRLTVTTLSDTFCFFVFLLFQSPNGPVVQKHNTSQRWHARYYHTTAAIGMFTAKSNNELECGPHFHQCVSRIALALEFVALKIDHVIAYLYNPTIRRTSCAFPQYRHSAADSLRKLFIENAHSFRWKRLDSAMQVGSNMLEKVHFVVYSPHPNKRLNVCNASISPLHISPIVCPTGDRKSFCSEMSDESTREKCIDESSGRNLEKRSFISSFTGYKKKLSRTLDESWYEKGLERQLSSETNHVLKHKINQTRWVYRALMRTVFKRFEVIFIYDPGWRSSRHSIFGRFRFHRLWCCKRCCCNVETSPERKCLGCSTASRTSFSTSCRESEQL